jgi:hypothetical protein
MIGDFHLATTAVGRAKVGKKEEGSTGHSQDYFGLSKSKAHGQLEDWAVAGVGCADHFTVIPLLASSLNNLGSRYNQLVSSRNGFWRIVRNEPQIPFPIWS